MHEREARNVREYPEVGKRGMGCIVYPGRMDLSESSQSWNRVREGRQSMQTQDAVDG